MTPPDKRDGDTEREAVSQEGTRTEDAGEDEPKHEIPGDDERQDESEDEIETPRKSLRSDRVRAIRRRILDGTYEIDLDDLAQKILDRRRGSGDS